MIVDVRPSRESYLGPSIDAGNAFQPELLEVARERLATHAACYFENVPPDVNVFVAWLSELGDPLPNYGTHGGTDIHALHPCVNRVRYIRGEVAHQYFHGRCDALPIHSARSWRNPRARYVAMLMVDPGWTDQPPGSNGESTMVRWSNALRHLGTHDPDAFETLAHTDLSFTANNVVEEISHGPIVFRLETMQDQWDWGVRLKIDILEKFSTLSDQLTEPVVYLTALKALIDTANDPAHQLSYRMKRGDLVILDNARCGHGRRRFVGERQNGTTVELNPRDLWSVTLG
jgi:hypothetical protein